MTDVTRKRVLHAVTHAVEPVGVTQVAACCGVHPNTVRLHLARLVEDGLVTRELDPHHGPGRPGYRYRANGAQPADEAAAYRRLAGLLARAVHTRQRPFETGYHAGVAEARSHQAEDGVATIVEILTREGFSPTVESLDPSGVAIRLGQCPFAAVAAGDPATVCQLHLGVVRGVADTMGVSITGVEVAPAEVGGCRLTLH